MADSESPKICEDGGKGMLFPLWNAEHSLPNALRAVLYAFVMVYLFLAINIVADKFMASVETITSVRKLVYDKERNLKMTKIVWNGTVANLTLLALGSSAPEILLSIVEIVRNDFYSGELGPSTIVGSAAFNLFIIVGTCIVSIPAGESRKIAQDGVFIITAIFSLLAYFWLVIIVQVWTPDLITIEEGLITLVLFPVLTLISYWSDRGYLNSFYEAFGHDRRTLPLRRYDEDVKDGLVKDVYGKPIRNPAGVLTFPEQEITVSVGEQDKEVDVSVLRKNGTKGSVTCKYSTCKMTAEPGHDFEETEGELAFDEGVDQQTIKLTLLPKRVWESDDRFQLCLTDAAGGVIFNPNGDGGEEMCYLTVNLQNENLDLATGCYNQICKGLDRHCNVDNWRNGFSSWSEEIHDALCEGFQDDNFCKSDCVFHVISLPWKLFFTVFTPPAELCGGWICFYCSLFYVGCLTAIVIDFAELFGCVTTLKDSITAITFVALGTSMPDLFASLTAAADDETADASIVNVTGSNSVNVFLGIGIPWFLAAVVWAFRGATEDWKKSAREVGFLDLHKEYENKGAFVVMGGDLGFSVTVFTLAALIGLAVIRVRRFKCEGELGGPVIAKWLSGFALGLLWCFYLFLSIWKAYNADADSGRQIALIFIALYILVSIFGCAAIIVCLYYWLAPVGDAELEDSAKALKASGSEDDDYSDSEDDTIDERAEVPYDGPVDPGGASEGAATTAQTLLQQAQASFAEEQKELVRHSYETNPLIPWEEAYREEVELGESGNQQSRSQARRQCKDHFHGSPGGNVEGAKICGHQPEDPISQSFNQGSFASALERKKDTEECHRQSSRDLTTDLSDHEGKHDLACKTNMLLADSQLSGIVSVEQETDSRHAPEPSSSDLSGKIQRAQGVIQQVKKALGEKPVIPVDDPQVMAHLSRTVGNAQACKEIIGILDAEISRQHRQHGGSSMSIPSAEREESAETTRQAAVHDTLTPIDVAQHQQQQDSDAVGSSAYTEERTLAVSIPQGSSNSQQVNHGGDDESKGPPQTSVSENLQAASRPGLFSPPLAPVESNDAMSARSIVLAPSPPPVDPEREICKKVSSDDWL